MAKISLNGIVNRYNEAFGVTAQKVAPRIIQLANRAGVNINLPGLDLYEPQKPEFASMVFTNGTTGKEYAFGINTSENKALPFFKFNKEEQTQGYLAPPPMVSFSRSKNVVETPIDRSEFEVLEYFGLKPFEIQIRGIIVDTDNHHYPQQLYKTVNEMFEAPGTYEVVGDLFNDLGIDEVFFRSDFQLNFVEGYVDTIKYSVRAKSISKAEFIVQQQ